VKTRGISNELRRVIVARLTQGSPSSGILALMGSRLYPCECCGRHIRPIDSSCPFCFTAQSAKWPAASQPRVVPRAGATRATLFAGALLMSPMVGVGGCGGSEQIAQPYGAPPLPPPEETIAQPYGAPPPEEPPPEEPEETIAPPDETPPEPPEETMAQPYGAPPLPRQEETIAQPYGAPPQVIPIPPPDEDEGEESEEIEVVPVPAYGGPPPPPSE